MESLLFGMLALIGVSFLSAISKLQNQVQQLQKKTAAIAEKLGIEDTVPPELQAEIDALLDEGKRIKAIKAYRQATGEGLKEATEIIDQMNQKKTSN